MRLPSFESALLVVLSAAAACGGAVSKEPGGAGGAGGSSADATSATSTSASTTDAVATSASTADATSTSAVTTATTGPAGGGGDPTGCAQLAPIQLSMGSFRGDDSMDGVWTAGESATVNVTLTNTSSLDVDYPGIEIASDNPLVTSPAPYAALFLIFGDEVTSLGVPFTADPAVPPNTPVTFTATLHSISDVSCTGLASYSFTATIE